MWMVIVGKLRDNEVVVIDELLMGVLKMKDFVGVLKVLKFVEIMILVVIEDYNVNVYKSVWNLLSVDVMLVLDLNVYLVLC